MHVLGISHKCPDGIIRCRMIPPVDTGFVYHLSGDLSQKKTGYRRLRVSLLRGLLIVILLNATGMFLCALVVVDSNEKKIAGIIKYLAFVLLAM